MSDDLSKLYRNLIHLTQSGRLLWRREGLNDAAAIVHGRVVRLREVLGFPNAFRAAISYVEPASRIELFSEEAVLQGVGFPTKALRNTFEVVREFAGAKMDVEDLTHPLLDDLVKLVQEKLGPRSVVSDLVRDMERASNG